jgi:hypothetical protein
MIAQVRICIEYQFEGNTQDVVVNREAVSAVIYCEWVRNAKGADMSDEMSGIQQSKFIANYRRKVASFS